jgi:hypothetical protein
VDIDDPGRRGVGKTGVGGGEICGRWGVRDINRILESVTEAFVFDERPMTITEPLQGKQKFQEYLTNLFAAFPMIDSTGAVGILSLSWSEDWYG